MSLLGVGDTKKVCVCGGGGQQLDIAICPVNCVCRGIADDKKLSSLAKKVGGYGVRQRPPLPPLFLPLLLYHVLFHVQHVSSVPRALSCTVNMEVLLEFDKSSRLLKETPNRSTRLYSSISNKPYLHVVL